MFIITITPRPNCLKSYNSNLSLAFLVYKKYEIQYTSEPCYKLTFGIRCLAANHCYHTSIQMYNIKYGCSSAIFWLKSALSSNFFIVLNFNGVNLPHEFFLAFHRKCLTRVINIHEENFSKTLLFSNFKFSQKIVFGNKIICLL